MSFNYTKENERYCYNCMAILPTKSQWKMGDLETLTRICLKCLKEIKPPEYKNEE